MNKRIRNLTALVALMVLAAIGLCACMIREQSQSSSDPSQMTTEFGYGVVDIEDETTESNDAGDSIGNESVSNDENAEIPDSTVETTVAPTVNTTVPTVNYQPGSLTFEEYLKLSGSEQQACALTFPSIGEYITWYNTEKEKHLNDSSVEITGPIDLSEIVGKNG